MPSGYEWLGDLLIRAGWSWFSGYDLREHISFDHINEFFCGFCQDERLFIAKEFFRHEIHESS